jgi:hypothetical protein
MKGGLPNGSDAPVLFRPVRGPQEPASNALKLPPNVGVSPYDQAPFGFRVVEKSAAASKMDVACAVDAIPKANVTPTATLHLASEITREIICFLLDSLPKES